MKKLMVSAFALAMMTTGAMAGEQLTTSQLDQVTAGVLRQLQRQQEPDDADRGRGSRRPRADVRVLQQSGNAGSTAHRLQQQCDRTGERRLALIRRPRTA